PATVPVSPPAPAAALPVGCATCVCDCCAGCCCGVVFWATDITFQASSAESTMPVLTTLRMMTSPEVVGPWARCSDLDTSAVTRRSEGYMQAALKVNPYFRDL